MRVFIPIDVPDLLSRARHLAVSTQIIEEHKTAVKVNPFKNEVCNASLHQRILVSMLLKLIVTVADKGITTQQMLICFPLIEDVVALFRAANRV